MSGTNEAFSRVKIDAQLKGQGREVLNTTTVRYESDYVFRDRHGRVLAVVEAKKAAIA